MRSQSYYNWLLNESISARYRLITLLEAKDKMLYVDAPDLRNAYLAAFGDLEDQVLEAELKVSLLQEKLRLIRIAVNRREKVDISAIEKKLLKKKELLLHEAEAADRSLTPVPQLTDEEKEEMQSIYKQIISVFHPAINTELTEAQKDLYQKATDAYRRQNYKEIKLLSNMLFIEIRDTEKISAEVVSDAKPDPDKKDSGKLLHSYSESLAADYSLAAELYECFEMQEDEAVILSAMENDNKQFKSLEKDIKEIRSGFPFNAEKVINDPAKAAEHREDLNVRLRAAHSEQDLLEKSVVIALKEGGLYG